MSGEANLETVIRFHDLMESGNREALAALLERIAHAECEWTPLVTEVEGGAYHGKDGARAFFDDFLGAFEVAYEDRDVRVLDEDVVVMLCTMSLRGRGSGVAVSQGMGVVYEFEDGLLRRGRAHGTQAEALAAAEAVRA